MGSRSAEDPMDLGPFMQNYVLNNPFNQLSAGRAKARKALREKKNSEGNKSEPTTSTAPPKTAPTPPRGDDIKVLRHAAKFVKDTPKGHFGSNIAFASSLKNNYVSVGYVDVQDWLWNNYRHIAGYGAITTMATLLEHVQTVFPYITSIVLSRVMKFSFPECHKLIHKFSGAYFQSLVKRPDPPDYDDATLVSAVDDILEGRANLSQAMAKYAVVEYRIVQMLVWEHNFMPFGADGKHVIGKAFPIKGSGEKLKDSDEELPCQIKMEKAGDPDSSDSSGAEGTEQDAVPNTGLKRLSDSERRKSRRKRKRRSHDDDFVYSMDKFFEDDRGSSDPEKAAGSSERVKVKEESGQPSEESGQPSDDASQDSAISSAHSKSDSKDRSSGDGEWGHSVDSGQAQLMEEMELLQERLQEERERSGQLEREMDAARQEADGLRMELKRRDDDFLLLANRFFLLNGQFQKMAHKVKAYMSQALTANQRMGIQTAIDVDGRT